MCQKYIFVIIFIFSFLNFPQEVLTFVFYITLNQNTDLSVRADIDETKNKKKQLNVSMTAVYGLQFKTCFTFFHYRTCLDPNVEVGSKSHFSPLFPSNNHRINRH